NGRDGSGPLGVTQHVESLPERTDAYRVVNLLQHAPTEPDIGQKERQGAERHIRRVGRRQHQRVEDVIEPRPSGELRLNAVEDGEQLIRDQLWRSIRPSKWVQPNRRLVGWLDDGHVIDAIVWQTGQNFGDGVAFGIE